MHKHCNRFLGVLLLILASGQTLAQADTTNAEVAPQETDTQAEAANIEVEPPAELKPLTATYSAALDKGVAINGSATRTLEQQPDGTWILRFDVDSFLANIEERTHFSWENGRVRPISYRYKLSGFMIKDRKRSIDYDWDVMSVTGEYEGKSFTMPLPPEALDPLGYQLQLRQDLKAGNEQVRYEVTDKGDFDEDQFAIIGTEVLDTKLGQTETVKAEKVRSEGSKRETLMWFAPELDYLLVKLVQVEPDGTRYEINIGKTNIR